MRSFVASFVTALVLAGCSTADSSPTGHAPAPQEQEVGQTREALTTVHHDSFNGGGAQFWQFAQYGSTSLRVYETGGGGASVDFSINAVDPTSEVCVNDQPPPFPGEPPPPPISYCYFTRSTYTYGFGSLPAKSFSVTAKTASLHANVANGSSFTLVTCTWDDSTWSGTCAPSTGGSIDLTWKADGQYSSFSTGVNEKRSGKYMFRSNGTFRTASAGVNGNVLGMAIATQGDVMRTTGVNVSMDFYDAPKP